MLSAETLDLLRQWWKARPPVYDATTPLQERWLFPGRKPGKPMTTRQLSRLFQEAADAAPAVQGLRRDRADDRGRSQASRRPHRYHRRAAHLGLNHDPPSAYPHDRAGRRRRIGWQAMAVELPKVPPARASPLASVPTTAPAKTPRRPQGQPIAVLRPACPSRRAKGLRGLFGAVAQDRVVALLKAAVRRTQGGARLSPRSNPHSVHCTAGARPIAISCLGAFWTPADRARRCHCIHRHPKTWTEYRTGRCPRP